MQYTGDILDKLGFIYFSYQYVYVKHVKFKPIVQSKSLRLFLEINIDTCPLYCSFCLV